MWAAITVCFFVCVGVSVHLSCLSNLGCEDQLALHVYLGSFDIIEVGSLFTRQHKRLRSGSWDQHELRWDLERICSVAVSCSAVSLQFCGLLAHHLLCSLSSFMKHRAAVAASVVMSVKQSATLNNPVSDRISIITLIHECELAAQVLLFVQLSQRCCSSE